MTTNRSIFAALLLALMPAHHLHAQPATEQASAEMEDVMQPTKLGIRMTPIMAKAFSRAYLRHGLDADGLLSESQEQQLADTMSRLVMAIAHKYDQHGRDFFEFAFEQLIRNQGRFDADQAREYAKRATPLIPAMQAFLQRLDGNARHVLDDVQYEDFARKLKRKQEAYDRFAQKMQRWSQGQVEPNERPFLDRSPPETSATQAADGVNRRKLQTARRRAERELRRFGPAEWERFLKQTKAFFAFTEEQTARAQRFLADARREAAGVMTSKWRRTFLLNRTKYHVVQTADHPVAPYRHQLDKEYDEFVRPIHDIGRRFETAVIALATSEQREAAVARLREFAESHGMTVVEANLEALLTVPGEE